MIQPRLLEKGDVVYLLNIARHGNCNAEFVTQKLESWGLIVEWGKTIQPEGHCQFAAPIDLRKQDIQHALDRTDVRALFFLRGGYGTVQLLDDLDFSGFEQSPKWLVGYSDITYLHSALNKLGYVSLHATMLSTWHSTSASDMESLQKTLFQPDYILEFTDVKLHDFKAIEAPVVGGNLSILHTQLGTPTDLDTDGKILVLEDVYENLMSIERMLWALKRNGKFRKLKALLLGDFLIPIKDNETSNNIVPGMPEITADNAQEAFEKLVLNFFRDADFPIVFGLTVGHSAGRNTAVKLGATVRLTANNGVLTLYYGEK